MILSMIDRYRIINKYLNGVRSIDKYLNGVER